MRPRRRHESSRKWTDIFHLFVSGERPLDRSAAENFTPPAHLRHLDGLRGIAILMVMLVHTSQLVVGLPPWARNLTFYGVRGVQLFFIVSGLTLALSQRRQTFSLTAFAARRFFRVAPMFYLGAALYLLLCATTNMDLPTRQATLLDVIATLLFVHGWVPSAINTVVPGGWSIAAEAMFYVMFPAILWLVPHRRAFMLAVATSFFIAGVANWALRSWLGPAGVNLSFSFWLVQFPAFASGCWLATLPTRPALRRIAGITLFVALFAMVVDSQLRGRSNLLVAIMILTLLAWAVNVARPRLLSGRVLPLIGRISFSLYILHFAVLGAFRPVSAKLEAAIGAGGALMATFAVALAVTGGLAMATYRWIEQPGIAVGRRLSMS